MMAPSTDDRLVLSPAAIERAVDSARHLSARAASGDLQLDMPANGRPAETVTVPAEAVRLMAGLLARLAAGHVVTLIPEHAELTVHQAADLLLVSPPFVLTLIGEGKLPSRMSGTARVVRYDELMTYKRRADADAQAAMVELTRETEAMGLYD
jgi:excisionase family DNA binding protein